MSIAKLALLTAFAAIGLASAQDALDGVNHPLADDLLDHLAGTWKATGQMQGQPLVHTFQVEWTLNHQFLHLHETDAAAKPAYEAHVYIGFDNMSERYVVHWIDVFGGRYSETLGYGKRTGDTIRFLFEYNDGPFTNTFTWDPSKRAWRFVLESKGKDGKWSNFGTFDLEPVKQ
jgi:hypothetical protein